MKPTDLSRHLVIIDCDDGNGYDKTKIGLRLSSIFVIWIGSTAGALIPIFLSQRRSASVSSRIFSSMKYFGSGVIIATAFIHLLAPATKALSSPCLTGKITEYSWAEGIVLISIFIMFFLELVAHRCDKFGLEPRDLEALTSSTSSTRYEASSKEQHSPPILSNQNPTSESNDAGSASNSIDNDDEESRNCVSKAQDSSREPAKLQYSSDANDKRNVSRNHFSTKLTAIYILEFGIIFHSIFIGLTLAVTGNDEYNILYIVLVFHQTFEGLGLGSRLASVTWPADKSWVSWLFGIIYGLTTPIAIIIGISIHETFDPDSQISMIVNGVFDSISAGILIYTGLVELMANEFIFDKKMNGAPRKNVLFACFNMSLGAAIMALLGKWA